jgi:hypothetical protein
MKKKISIGHFIAILLVSVICTELYAQHTTEFLFVETAPPDIRETMQKNSEIVFAEINKAYHQNEKTLKITKANATPKAIKRIQSLWKVSHFYCTETDITTRVLKQSNSRGWQVRNIPVLFKEGKTDEDRYKNLAIEFTLDGKIKDVYIVLWEHDYPNLIEKTDEVANLRYRQKAIEFMENFRTAYSQKNIDFIKNIFADDQLNIKSKTQQGDSLHIEYATLNKKEYLAKLSKVFKSSAYINVKFDSIVIKQHEGNPKIFGVTLHQTLNSSNYSDEGWLFFMLDYENEDKPRIWISTWQPLKDNLGNPIHYNTEDIFSLGHFDIK